MKKLILLLAISCCFKTSYTQPGTLDPTFGDKGIVSTDFGASTNIYGAVGRQLFTQPDRTIYLILEINSQTLITHLLPNGSIDSSYGTNGYSESVGIMYAVGALQIDGKIVVGGSNETSSVLYRYNSDGTIDSTFSANGIKSDFSIRSIAIQSDGKIGNKLLLFQPTTPVLPLWLCKVMEK